MFAMSVSGPTFSCETCQRLLFLPRLSLTYVNICYHLRRHSDVGEYPFVSQRILERWNFGPTDMSRAL